MDTYLGVRVNKEIMESRKCIKCERVLQKTTYDKCMYCGAVIPIELRLSDEQKEDITDKQEQEHKRQMSKQKSSSNESDDSTITTGIIIGSDFTSGGGDCG